MRTLAIVVALLGFPTFASAQHGPSENDLFAAYCTGALRAEIPVYRQRWLSDENAPSDWLKKALIDELARMQDRLATTARYLAARGYDTSSTAPTSRVLFAISAGESDFAHCDSFRGGNNERILTECRGFYGNNRESVDQCVAKQQPVVCHQIEKCGDVSRLPM